MLRILVITLLALAVVVATAAAETGTPTPTTTTTQSATPTSNPNQGAYDKLSPGNQKIAQALYDAQKTNTQTSSSTSTSLKPMSRDDIAAMKQHKGWGEIFKDLKAKGYYSEYKNLGQVVSRAHSQAKSPSGTTITTGSGRSEVVGKSGKGYMDDNASAGMSGGHGSDSGPSTSSGRGGNSGQGGGRGK